MTTPYAVPAGSAGQLADLRADLAEVGYTSERLQELLGPLAAAALHRQQTLPARRALAASTDPAAVLVRLLVLGLPVSAAELTAALPRTGADGLVRLRLARPSPAPSAAAPPAPASDPVTAAPPASAVPQQDVADPGTRLLRATCDLRPYGDERHDWWLASDLSELALGTWLPTDHVLGIGGASTTLASWTPRPSVRRALDLGTGCGIQALHLATHAEQVVATDLSERALSFARFNAALNGVPLDVRAGSFLQPVAGDQFDLVVSNPPFVITPRREEVPRYEYRDGGAEGDTIVAHLVRDLPGVLAPGGIAQLLGNWELRPGEDWASHVRAWVAGTGLDAWVIQRETQDVAEYAETWARDGGHRPATAAFDGLYQAWLEDFARRGIDRVGFGILTLQRPATGRQPFHHLEEVLAPVQQPAGPALLRGLRARTWLAEHSDADVLARPWSVAADVTEERVGRPGQTDPMVIQLRQGSGLRRTVRLDTVTAGLVGACDGELSAEQILRGIAVLTDTPVAELRDPAVQMLRALVADGLLQTPELSW